MSDKPEVQHQQNIEIPVYISFTAKVLKFISPVLASRFAARLFGTPFKHKMPKRERKMDQESHQYRMKLRSADKEFVVYEYGSSEDRILLVHGWSGRGTQLSKIAERLIEKGYSTVSFDAPAHGKAPGSQTQMLEFIETVILLNEKYGGFKAGIGHSLGGMTLLNAYNQGLRVDKLVTIGSGDKVWDIVLDFNLKIGLNHDIAELMVDRFNEISGVNIHELSASIAARTVDIPVLVIHDEDDRDVPLSAGLNIAKHLPQAELMTTSELGHRKILGDSRVIDKIIDFLK
ncbi:alpha/beta fold hydrolase [Robertkochia aurantiaca]|uniref:alpha/beta fold hydrolase n=1 Tax=Robertkochia aurantiaca TaxID=2873700 RepID=UPI001CCB8DE3|nr:alpha/beta hydrolase [Robertkochia sp. 3YJGBD-33]